MSGDAVQERSGGGCPHTTGGKGGRNTRGSKQTRGWNTERERERERERKRERDINQQCLTDSQENRLREPAEQTDIEP